MIWHIALCRTMLAHSKCDRGNGRVPPMGRRAVVPFCCLAPDRASPSSAGWGTVAPSSGSSGQVTSDENVLNDLCVGFGLDLT